MLHRSRSPGVDEITSDVHVSTDPLRTGRHGEVEILRRFRDFYNIDPPGSDNSAGDGWAVDINDAGAIVGKYKSTDDNMVHGFLLR